MPRHRNRGSVSHKERAEKKKERLQKRAERVYGKNNGGVLTRVLTRENISLVYGKKTKVEKGKENKYCVLVEAYLWAENENIAKKSVENVLGGDGTVITSYHVREVKKI